MRPLLPNSGKWRYEAMPIHGYRILNESNTEIVDNIYSEEVAARIVSDHTTAEAVPTLLKALHDVRQQQPEHNRDENSN